jgi:multidrug resistance efflux pump
MTVTAKWERPDGRRQLSVTAPLFVDVDGTRVRARDWSLNGFTVSGDARTWPLGATRDVKVTLPFQGFEISFDAPVRVVEDNRADKVVGVDYVSLGSRERELLRHFLDELVRGSMSDIHDTIQRIDVPVSPVAIGVPPRESHSTSGTSTSAVVSRLTRQASPAMMTGLYAGLGALVFGYLGYLAYAAAFRLEVETAVLSAPTEILTAHGDGMITWGNVRPGDTVKSGDVLVNVFDNQLEREIELSEITVREREARFSLLQKRVLDELTRLQSAVDGASPAGSKVRLEVESLRARVQANEQELRRVTSRPRDAQSAARIEEAKKKLLANQKALEGKQVDMRTRLEREVLAGGTRASTAGQTAYREMTVLEAQMAQAEQDYEFAQLRHQSVLAHRVRLAVRAPFDGVLVAMPRSDRTAVRKGETVAVIEQEGTPRVTARVTPTDAMRIGLGDAARLYVPGTGAYLTARVTHIDRMLDTHKDTGRTHSDTMSARTGVTNSAEIVLDVERPELIANRQQYASGLPVVVQFKRRWSTAAAQAVSQGASRSLATAREAIGPPVAPAEAAR